MKINLSQARGFSNHRYGWGYCLNYLSAYHSGAGIFVDDFIERSFSWQLDSLYYKNAHKLPYKQPWIGFLHNPHNMPEWFDYYHSPQSIFSREVFQESLSKCKCLVVLSEYLAAWVRSQTDVPVITLKHPTGIATEWSPYRFLKSNKKLIQVGYWLRDINSIARIQMPDYEKNWLPSNYNKAVNYMHMHVESPAIMKMLWQDVKILDFMDNAEYDRLYSESIIFLDLLDSSANNAIVEAIIRNTPVLVNRHPAVEEYLGVDYPLFYDSKTAPCSNRIIEAHNYLKNMNKEWIYGEYFAKDFMTKLRNVL